MQKSAGTPDAHPASSDLSDLAPVWQDDFSLAVDQALRRAIAKFRFDVAECQLAGKTFNKDPDPRHGPNNKFGFGCGKSSSPPPPPPPKCQKAGSTMAAVQEALALYSHLARRRRI